MVLTRPEPPARTEDERVWRVATQTVDPRSMSPTLTLYGRLESPRASTLSAAVTADVEEVPAREGRPVEAGDKLVALERSDMEALVQQREADLAEIRAQMDEARVEHEANQNALARQRALVDIAERGLERARRLADQDANSQEDLDAARRNLEQARLALTREQRAVNGFSARMARLQAQESRAQARLDQARRDLARTRITAPFDGRLTSVSVAPGERVRPGDPLVALYDTSQVEARATIPGPRVPAVRQALAADEPVTARVRVDGRTLPARLDRLGGRSPDGASGVAGLFRLTEDAPADLPLGRFSEVDVELPPRPNLVAVPPAAVYERDRVYVVREDRLQAITVERVGTRARPGKPDQLLIRSDALRAGDELVTTQFPNASDGLRVRVAEEDSGE